MACIVAIIVQKPEVVGKILNFTVKMKMKIFK